jgi:hypothetical protein
MAAQMVIAFGLPSTRTTNPMPWNPNRKRSIPGAPKDLNAVIRGGQADISAESHAEQLSPGRHRRPRPYLSVAMADVSASTAA